MDVFSILKDYSFPEEWQPLNFSGDVDYELRFDIANDILLDDVYYPLENLKTKIQMNIRTKNGEITEIYPLATPENLKEFGVTEYKKHPYLSVDMETGEPTHCYYVPTNSDGTMLKRVDHEGHIRTYRMVLTPVNEKKVVQQIFKKYHPNYIFLYYDSDSTLTEPVAALLGYNKVNPHYGDYLSKLS